MDSEKKDTGQGAFELYTQNARKVVVLAQEEARSMEHLYLGSEHLLLGLLRVEEGVPRRALSSLGVTLERTRECVERTVGRNVGREGLKPSDAGQLHFTPRAKEVLTQALFEARWLGHDRHVGPEHLLLGLSGQYEGAAAMVLREYGAAPGKIRGEVMKSISRGYPQKDQMATSGKTIEDWVGQRVSAAVENAGNGEPGRFKCTLEGVDDRGIVVSYRSNASEMTRFYPWHTVPYINLVHSEDSGKLPRRAGFSSA